MAIELRNKCQEEEFQKKKTQSKETQHILNSKALEK